jgi:signal peptidase I
MEKIKALWKNQELREAITLILIAVVTFFGLRLTIQSYIVYGPSMQPNFEENERIIVNKVVYSLHDPRRGDVIVFKPPFNETKNYIKRVIGLPGESVEIVDGKTYIYTIDGTILVLDEPYEAEPSMRDYTKHTVPDGQYFVMGDNRNNSNDSRTGWMVPSENIVGKAWLIIWPPDSWGFALNYPFTESAAQASE